jgi:hypothetical protein
LIRANSAASSGVFPEAIEFPGKKSEPPVQRLAYDLNFFRGVSIR